MVSIYVDLPGTHANISPQAKISHLLSGYATLPHIPQILLLTMKESNTIVL